MSFIPLRGFPFHVSRHQSFHTKIINNMYLKYTRSGFINSISSGVHGIVLDIYMQVSGAVNNSVNIQKTHQYVLKIVPISGDDDVKSFEKEVHIGMLPKIEQVGPRIHAALIIPGKPSFINKITQKSRDKINVNTKSFGFYIMDNFTSGAAMQGVQIMKLYDYIKNGCPVHNHKFYRLLNKKLTQFYKITGGYHGDLHFNNIVVLLKSTNNNVKFNGPNLLDIVIFDYGAHKSFKTKLTNSMCLKDILQQIRSEFLNDYYALPQSQQYALDPQLYPGYANTQTDMSYIYPKNNQIYARNNQHVKKMLKNKYNHLLNSTINRKNSNNMLLSYGLRRRRTLTKPNNVKQNSKKNQ